MKQYQIVSQIIFDSVTKAYGVENTNRLNAFCTRLALDIDEIYPKHLLPCKCKMPKHNCDLCGARIILKKIEECEVLCHNCICERDEKNNN